MIKEAIEIMTADSQVRSAMVADAMRIFPGSSIQDEGSEARFEAFRELARKHYPDIDPFDRILHGFAVLNDVIAMMETGAARARHLHRQMSEIYNAAIAEAEEDIDL